MISVFFNEAGYYIKGDGIEVARSCPPALTESGSTVLPPLHHLYAVLYHVMKEVQTGNGQEDIMIYSDSRLIEEINGVIESMDDTCTRWVKQIRRNLIPAVRSCVIFRKKSSDLIGRRVQEGLDRMIGSVDVAVRDAAMAKHINQVEEKRTSDTLSRVHKFTDAHKALVDRKHNNGKRQD